MTAPATPEVWAIVLAAGSSRRMGDVNKLLLPLEGVPLVAHAVDAALACRARGVVVVTGHGAGALRAALPGRPVRFAHNPEHAAGLSSSLRAGLAALPPAAAGALICLGDMPRVRASQLDALIAAFEASAGREVCVPVHRGRRGNPILWPARRFEAMGALEGDVGARALLAEEADRMRRVEMDDAAIHADIDTPADLAPDADRG